MIWVRVGNQLTMIFVLHYCIYLGFLFYIIAYVLVKKKFTWKYILTDETPCDPDPCENGGTCARNGFDFSCGCVGYYTGTTCTEGNL